MIEKDKIEIRTLVFGGMFVALMAVGAVIKIPLPGIPFSLQTLFVLLAGLLLGARGGLMAMLGYILIGLAGLPVFTGGGGLMYVFKPSFGYLIGFAVGAFVTGKVAEKNTANSTRQMFIAVLAGTGAIYAFGLPWYYFIANYYLNTPIGATALVMSGFVMTLPGDLIKMALSIFLAQRLAPFVSGLKSKER
ncbi:biotin transporter BioY [Acetobacterium woodii]|uniref:Biotin transporter n=1 Tax=Acetobacterium woodii (strain ATCC 29683 / DSM 1030 / JCM 2381 / KCTC 1655 / WB1) TaxID=931626 RepID=H6LEX5_ACEWD|nr:biotin transporter BioY [Acetobacterium woodii]AFA46881.1 biotin biosynthesis protein BioY [Acetobacterium woodii DSM 1030]